MRRQHLLVLGGLLSVGLFVFVTLVWQLAHQPHVSDNLLALQSGCLQDEPNLRVTSMSPTSDGDWRIVHASGDTVDTTGRTAREVQGQLASEIYPGDEAEQLRQIGAQVLRTGEPQERTATVNGVNISTQIVRPIPGVVTFCTLVDEQP